MPTASRCRTHTSRHTLRGRSSGAGGGDWLRADDGLGLGLAFGRGHGGGALFGSEAGPINFLSLLHPASSPKLRCVSPSFLASVPAADDAATGGGPGGAWTHRGRGGEMMPGCATLFSFPFLSAGAAWTGGRRFGNWAVQRWVEAAAGLAVRRKIVACMWSRVVDLATNCYGRHVLQKALDCAEEEVRLLIVTWRPRADARQQARVACLEPGRPRFPPLSAYAHACAHQIMDAHAAHLCVHAFETLKERATDALREQCGAVFGAVAKSVLHPAHVVLEHRAPPRARAERAGVGTARKEGGKDTFDRVVRRMCEPAKGYAACLPSFPSLCWCVLMRDLGMQGAPCDDCGLALSLTGSVLPTVRLLPRAARADGECIRGHIGMRGWVQDEREAHLALRPPAADTEPHFARSRSRPLSCPAAHAAPWDAETMAVALASPPSLSYVSRPCWLYTFDDLWQATHPPHSVAARNLTCSPLRVADAMNSHRDPYSSDARTLCTPEL
ncbi:hypothetical protein FB451DRAFT_1563343 [Mycena latifolia]|nr:hypothetical protein FB451DRAFT_1563343 [Mycena latifolia]